jgi:C1A family cysteine protease
MKTETHPLRTGWIPDLPDHRDHLYAASPIAMTKIPASVDLRKACPSVYNQGNLGSCTANAIAAAFEFEQGKQGEQEFVPSRLFIYYNERAMEHTINSDSGAQIRDGIKSVNKLGVCPESLWTYDDGPEKFKQKPSSASYTSALKNQLLSYKRLMQSLVQMKACLAEGYPFVFGFTVYDNIFAPSVAKTGHLPLPKITDHIQGGHAVMAVGFDDKNNWFIVRNSWGEQWGMSGYFTMPYEYLTNSDLAADFWTIRLVE